LSVGVKLAVMPCGELLEPGVYVTWQLEIPDPPVWVRVQLALLLKLPLPLGATVHETEPSGKTGDPLESVSLTVAVQVVVTPTSTVEGAQLTAVAVDRALTVTVKPVVVLLLMWRPSLAV
jgi:hypothetical protein